MTGTTDGNFDWQPFIGRSLAHICLAVADKTSSTVLEKGEFLMGLGLPRKEAALVIGSTDESLRVLAKQKAKRTSSPRKDAP